MDTLILNASYILEGERYDLYELWCDIQVWNSCLSKTVSRS